MFSNPDLESVQPMLRRTSRISWAPSGWFIDYAVKGEATAFHLFTCPDDFYAIRVGFANIRPESYFVERIIAAASSTIGDFANPTGGSPWVTLTYANGGADVDNLVVDRSATQRIIIEPAHVFGQQASNIVPNWNWTDWTPISSVPRDDSIDAPRVIMVRSLLLGSQTITQPNGNSSGYFRNLTLNHGFEHAAGWVPANFVTGQTILSNPAAAMFGEARSTIGCIQFLTKNRGIVGMAAGDSHHQGTSSRTQFLNYLLRATVMIGSNWVGKIPFGYVSTAVGGATSEQFFTMLLALLPAIRPSFVVLPGWTYNDRGELPADEAACSLFMARLVQAAESCMSSGAVPIFLTPFPRDRGSMTPIQMAPWRKQRQSILSMRHSGSVVIDATAVLGAQSQDGLFDGTYLPGLSSDGVHPNDYGHLAVARALMVQLNLLIGASSLLKGDSGNNQ